MEESWEKLLLLDCLMLAIVPSFLYADRYGIVKVKLYPIQGSINIIVEVQFSFDN